MDADDIIKLYRERQIDNAMAEAEMVYARDEANRQLIGPPYCLGCGGRTTSFPMCPTCQATTALAWEDMPQSAKDIVTDLFGDYDPTPKEPPADER